MTAALAVPPQLSPEVPDPGTQAVSEACERAPLRPEVVMLDLRHVTSLDRATALLVVRLDLRIRAVGGRLIVLQGTTSLHHCFDPIHLVGLLEIVEAARATRAESGV